MPPRFSILAPPRRFLTHHLAPLILPRPAAYYSSSSPSTEDAAARRAEARKAWIARLKAEHGIKWEAVVRESEQRAARNEARIHQEHKRLKAARAAAAKEEKRKKAEERKAEKAKWRKQAQWWKEEGMWRAVEKADWKAANDFASWNAWAASRKAELTPERPPPVKKRRRPMGTRQGRKRSPARPRPRKDQSRYKTSF